MIVDIFKSFYRNLGRPKFFLILANIPLIFFLILLNNLSVLPIKNLGNFLFFVFLLLLLALYRPGWSFLFFVGTIALENINIAPVEIGINIRPYQLLATLTVIAILVRLAVKRLNFRLPQWKSIDVTLIIFAIAGFISMLFSLDKFLSFKQSVIAASFMAIYFLIRIFVQDLDDLKKIIPFFLSSSVVVMLYSIWQNVAFMRGAQSFEVMPGRPNGTFMEPDWLGIYITLLIAAIYAIIYHFKMHHSNLREEFKVQISKCKMTIQNLKLLSLFIYLTLAYITLVLTVSRSAWLGVLIISILYLAFCIWHFVVKNKNWRSFWEQLVFLTSAGIISVAIVYVFNLTSFQLFNRFQSTGTGLQKITISCDSEVQLPNEIRSIDELNTFNCRHINLEEIEVEKRQGKHIAEIYRPDPNVGVRSQIYQKSWEKIKTYPLFGIGWGNIGLILGKDERGITLNSSNIFLETWLGSGILGLLALVFVWVYTFIKGIKFFQNDNLRGKSLGLFLFLGAISLLIPNLFNAGIFMGVLWLFFGITIGIESNGLGNN